MTQLDWLTARPIAHRGLHDAVAGRVENTASAFAAAVARGYGIECDLQVSADGEAMVHHDAALGRLTEGRGTLATLSAADLKRVAFKETGDRMITLGELADLVAGRVPLVLELKGVPDANGSLARRVVSVLRGYAGPVCGMSFQPDLVAALRHLAPALRRGIVAQRHYRRRDWPDLSGTERIALPWLLHAGRTRPHFIAYRVGDLPAATPLVAHQLFKLPLLTWTVRSEEDRRRAARWADQMIFEGFCP